MEKEKQRGQKRAVIRFLSETDFDKALKLPSAAIILGREKGDLIILDPEISSTHCQIQFIDASYHLFDMNSTNGTFVNSKRVLRQKLEHQDRITLGQTTLLFTFEDEDDVKHIPTVSQNKKEAQVNTTKVSIIDTLVGDKSSGLWVLKLFVTYPDGEFEEIQLSQSQAYIGRGAHFGKFDQDVEMSRRHLILKINDGGEVFAEDLGSTNGSTLNGEKLKGIRLLAPHDLLIVGACKIRAEAMRAA